MKNISMSSVVIVCMVCAGCTSIMKKMYGLKDPDFESHTDIQQFQHKIGFEGIPYYGLKAECWEQNKIFSVPDVFVFNAAGRYIPYKDSLKPNCNGPAELFLTELDTQREYSFSDKYTLVSFLEKLEEPECQPLVFDYTTKSDFYIFMTYSVFSGKRIFREKSKIWLDSLKNNKQIRYQLFMVNEDFKDCWSPEHKKVLGAAD